MDMPETKTRLEPLPLKPVDIGLDDDQPVAENAAEEILLSVALLEIIGLCHQDFGEGFGVC